MIIESELKEIIEIIKKTPQGISRGDIQSQLSVRLPDSTLYKRLKYLVTKNKIHKTGRNRWTRYFFQSDNVQDNFHNKNENAKDGEKSQLSEVDEIDTDISSSIGNIFSTDSQNRLLYLNNPPYARKNVTYHVDFLEAYIPNQTFYLVETVRQELSNKGKRLETVMAAGTYARQILNRLLINLSYNSSRLEGNTYSELDTQRLIEKSITPEGKVHEETVMIINHKEAISFLVENATDINLDPFTIRNIHHLLSQDLLKNTIACGDIRKIDVDIMKSAYKPASGYIFLKEKLELLLLKSRKIKDPYEQSFFLLLHISYLQAFEDVNKRTARLACNIPFIKNNLCPLSFVGLPKEDYISAILLFYEKNDYSPMVDLFRWAYLKSCEKYDTVRQSVGNLDEFRVRYRKQRKDCIGEVIRHDIHGQQIEDFTKQYCQKNGINQEDRFIAMVITELDTWLPDISS